MSTVPRSLNTYSSLQSISVVIEVVVPEIPYPAPAEGQVHLHRRQGRRAVASGQLHSCPEALRHVCHNGISRVADLSCRHQLIMVLHIIQVDAQSGRGVPEGVSALEVGQSLTPGCRVNIAGSILEV